MKIRTQRLLGCLAAVFSLCLLRTPLLAVDGVVEINQAGALAGGVVSGDTAGFPVTIGQSGSYRLTGNLTVTNPATTALQVSASSVTIDLNGFTIQGPTSCTGVPLDCSPTGSASGINAQNLSDIRVFNGVVRGFPEFGVIVGTGGRLESVHADNNGAIGITVGGSSVVISSTAAKNGTNGIQATSGSGSTIATSSASSNGAVGFSVSRSVVSNCTAVENLADGIRAATSTTVSGCVAISNGGAGIRALDGSLIIGSTAKQNTGGGLHFNDPTSAYGNNVFTDNNGAPANPQVTGFLGLKLSNNACGLALCP